MLIIGRTDVILQEGDSLGGEDTASLGYMVHKPMQLAHIGAMPAAVPNSTTRVRPSWRNAATNGATTAIVAARIAAEVAACNPTVFIVSLGINDASSAVARATTLANFTTIFAALPTSCRIIAFDPLCFGEKWPSGQNTTPSIDAAIDNISTDLQALLATTYASRSTFVSWRNGVYAARESQLNTPGPGVTIGPLCRPDPSGQHPNATGTGYITSQAAANISFAA